MPATSAGYATARSATFPSGSATPPDPLSGRLTRRCLAPSRTTVTAEYSIAFARFVSNRIKGSAKAIASAGGIQIRPARACSGRNAQADKNSPPPMATDDRTRAASPFPSGPAQNPAAMQTGKASSVGAHAVRQSTTAEAARNPHKTTAATDCTSPFSARCAAAKPQNAPAEAAAGISKADMEASGARRRSPLRAHQAGSTEAAASTSRDNCHTVSGPGLPRPAHPLRYPQPVQGPRCLQ